MGKKCLKTGDERRGFAEKDVPKREDHTQPMKKCPNLTRLLASFLPRRGKGDWKSGGSR